jgi:hypothetical protein
MLAVCCVCFRVITHFQGLTKVEEELGKDVNSQQAVGGQVEVGETHDSEQDGQDDETAELDGLAANGVNGSNRDPVSRDGTGQNDNQVTNGGVVEELVDVADGLAAGGETNDLENLSIVQGETVESDIQAEPRTSSSDQEKEVLALGVVAAKVAPAGLGNLEVLLGVLGSSRTGDFIRFAFALTADVSLDIAIGLLNIAGNIESVSRGFGDGKTDCGKELKVRDVSCHEKEAAEATYSRGQCKQGRHRNR